jgi:hypothetical protein
VPPHLREHQHVAGCVPGVAPRAVLAQIQLDLPDLAGARLELEDAALELGPYTRPLLSST